MTRKSSRRLKLNPEVRPFEREIRQFLDEEVQNLFKPLVLPEGCNYQITWLEPSVMRELKIRERKALRRARGNH